MKYFKVMIMAIVALFTFAAADAQVRVQIGGHRHPYHRHVVVVHHRYHHWHHRY